MSNLTQISREQAGEEWDDIPSDATFTVQSKSRGTGRVPQSLIPTAADFAAGNVPVAAAGLTESKVTLSESTDVGAADTGKRATCTAAITLTFAAPATLGTNFSYTVRAKGFAVTITRTGTNNVVLDSGDVASVFVDDGDLIVLRGVAVTPT